MNEAMNEEPAGRGAARVSKVAADVLWWLGLILMVLVAAWLLLSPVAMSEFGFAPEVGVDISIAEGTELRTRSLPSSDADAALDPLLETERARLEITTRSWWLQFLVTAVLLPLLGLMVAGLYLLRSFLGDVLAGEVFTAENASRLSWVGWILVVLGFADPAIQYGRACLVLNRVGLEGAALAPPAEFMLFPLVLSGALVLVLAAAWRYGVELQVERDLTV